MMKMAASSESRDINTLRREKDMALISLGKQMHKMLRDGVVSDVAGLRLAERISQIDAELYRLSGSRIPGPDEGICPGCGEAMDSAASPFCGGCGMNITEYYAREVITCSGCGQLTLAVGSYCAICGMLRPR